ncbi:p40 [Matsumuraeses phaseoli granulovirus]|uniref:P40 n=1 Tax=Matsumuraeses phaseoli granulovirus TaxID=2760664 RepID=A0AAE7MLH1_9BBAC|nr:p40 [Matsumuraeses phaseoli granulovirus]QOD40039.1 p40 [Matsumuraeses phaseoli granulovirus]
MSSAKIRLFLTIEKLKNAMDDSQMTYPFWEKFFPLLGNANTISIELSTLGELINEAAETAEQLVVTQGGVLFSQYLQGGNSVPVATNTNDAIAPSAFGNTRHLLLPQTSSGPVVFDSKKYHTSAEKMATYFVSASSSSTVYTVKDVVKLFLYISHVPKYKHLFEMLEMALFRKDKECIPAIGNEKTLLILDNLRDLTTITNFRLDYESMVSMTSSIQRALNNELTKYPQIKVQEFFTTTNMYEKEVDPYKAYSEKFQLLVEQKSGHHVLATDNVLSFNKNPLFVESIAANIEFNCDMNRMVYNSMNNIFINMVEQCAAENVKFDMADYNKRFRILDRVREKLRNNYVEKVAMGDVGIRKRSKTVASSSQPPIALKKLKPFPGSFVDNHVY